MVLYIPEDRKLAMPFHIGVHNSETGPRFGGRPPINAPSTGIPSGKYLATLPLSMDPLLDFSVFLEWDRFLEFDGPANELSSAGLEFVDIVVGEPAARASRSSIMDGPFQEHSLILLPADDDEYVDDMVTPKEFLRLQGHKLGGDPGRSCSWQGLTDALDRAYAQGYRHIAQFDFPGRDDASISGDWPFGGGLFSVFAKPPFDSRSWLWLRQL